MLLKVFDIETIHWYGQAQRNTGGDFMSIKFPQ